MSSAEFISLAIGTATVLGGIGYAIGQFISARRKGLAESLQTAVAEIAVLNGVVTRLEQELHRQADELARVKAENTTLRSVVTGVTPSVISLIEEKAAEMREFARSEHEKTRRLIKEVRNGG